MSKNISFVKMNGAGNDYIIIDNTDCRFTNLPKLSTWLSNRNFAIGSDGIVVLEKSNVADFRMRIFNTDGSEGKMCGNGIRCLAKYVYDNNKTIKKKILFETLSGTKCVFVQTKKGFANFVSVSMGNAKMCETKTIDNKTYFVTNVGNMHATTIVQNLNFNIEPIAKKVQSHFNDGINVEFVKIVDKSHIDMRVFERGSGETLSCGTGACASVFALSQKGIISKKTVVKTLGGNLVVTNRNKNMFLLGPAKLNFSGEIEIQNI